MGKKKSRPAPGKRLTKYDTHVLPRLLEIEAWARDGVIDEDIAKKLGIAYSTFCEYKKRSELSEALKKSKAVADIIVENALFKKACGYTVKVEKTFKCKVVKYDPVSGRKVSEEEELRTGTDEVHVPADTTAQIYWLNNRKPDVWRQKQEQLIRHEDMTIEVEFDDVDGIGI